MGRERGQAISEYAGVLAVVALIVAAVVGATPVPQWVAGAFERAVCRVTAADCPAPPAPPDAIATVDAPAAQPLLARPISAVRLQEDENGDGVVDPVRREGNGWRRCPPNYICLYADEDYRREIWRRHYGLYDRDVITQLPGDARDRTRSWVNNTPYDYCGSNTYWFHVQPNVTMPGSSHSDGSNRSPRADGGDVDMVLNCPPERWIDPDPLAPVEAGGPDCPHGFLCLYDGPAFRDELYRVDLRLDEGETIDDLDLDLPGDVRNRVGSWAKNSPLDICGYEEDRYTGSVQIPMSPSEPWRLVDGGTTTRAQDRWVGRQQNNTLDGLGPCDR